METPERIALMTQLVAGLCSVKKYFEFDDDGWPELKTCNMGESWKEEGGWQRAQSLIVAEALALLMEIEKAAKTIK
jgi:hypothetical protein